MLLQKWIISLRNDICAHCIRSILCSGVSEGDVGSISHSSLCCRS